MEKYLKNSKYWKTTEHTSKKLWIKEEIRQITKYFD